MVRRTRLEVIGGVLDKAYVSDGDVGCGAPGSLCWHKCAVAELSIDERFEYFNEVLPTLSEDDCLNFATFLVLELFAEALQDDNSN